MAYVAKMMACSPFFLFFFLLRVKMSKKLLIFRFGKEVDCRLQNKNHQERVIIRVCARREKIKLGKREGQRTRCYYRARQHSVITGVFIKNIENEEKSW